MRRQRPLPPAILFLGFVACGGAVTSASPPAKETATDSGTPEAQEAGVPETPPMFITRISAPGCLPQQLPVNASGLTTCSVFESLPGSGDESSCDGEPGLSVPDAAALAALRNEGATGPICLVEQLAPAQGASTCATSTAPGWCYVTGTAAAPCAQTIAFSPGGLPASSASAWLGCP